MFQLLRAPLLLAVALGISSSGAAFAQQPPSPPFSQAARQPLAWWKSDVFQKELGLAADQIARIDTIWEKARPELQQEFAELSRLEEKLSRQIRADADEATLSRQIDRVETARANANKTRSLMLVQMRKVLSPEQRIKLDALRARGQQDQRPPEGTAPPPRDSHKKPED